MAGEVWRAWLAAAVLWASLPVGALAMAMMTRLIPGTWRDSLAGPLALTPRVWLVAALAMAPVLLLPGLFYDWVSHPQGGGFRHVWLSPAFFSLRGVAWLGLLGFLAWRMSDGKARIVTSTLGLLILVPVSTVMADDWMMSLDPDFASSGFGLYVLSIQINAALALAVAAASRMGLSDRALDVIGGVLLVCLILWIYLGFMQYFIIWSGDLPGGVGWYLRRGQAWAPLVWAAIALKVGPGCLLIFNHVRRNPRFLCLLALAMAVGAVPEVGWLVLPAPGAAAGPVAPGLYALLVLALGGLTLGLIHGGRTRLEARP
jgi:hypothetical protein